MAKSKKKTKSVIPKRIAGVKVPKKVRYGPFGELLASKTGQAVIAKAILGAEAEAAAPKAKSRRKARPAKDADQTLWTPDYGAPDTATRQ